MSLARRLRRLLGGGGPAIRVHVLVRGRFGAGWQDIDRTFALAPGSTLADLLDEAGRQGVALRDLLERSPHLRHGVLLDGERLPLPEGLSRPLSDGAELYLLAPIAGG